MCGVVGCMFTGGVLVAVVGVGNVVIYAGVDDDRVAYAGTIYGSDRGFAGVVCGHDDVGVTVGGVAYGDVMYAWCC